jgi:hypothetical protein
MIRKPPSRYTSAPRPNRAIRAEGRQEAFSPVQLSRAEVTPTAATESEAPELTLDATQREAIARNLTSRGLDPNVNYTLRQTGRGSAGTAFEVSVGRLRVASGTVGSTRSDEKGRLYADLNAWQDPTSAPLPGEAGREQVLRTQEFYRLVGRGVWAANPG